MHTIDWGREPHPLVHTQTIVQALVLGRGHTPASSHANAGAAHVLRVDLGNGRAVASGRGGHNDIVITFTDEHIGAS